MTLRSILWMVVFTPAPQFISLKCRVCGTKKRQLDEGDDIVVSGDWSIANGTWYCPNGHANEI